MLVKINGSTCAVTNNPDYAQFWGWVTENRWEPHTFQVLNQYLTPQTTYIDLGAWIGPTVMYAAYKTNHCIAVEPDPIAFQELILNLNLNDQTFVETRNIAITDYVGKIEIGSALLGASTTRVNPAAGGNMGAWEKGQTVEVPCMTLEKFLKENNVSGPLFIKMDVEGSEEDICKNLSLLLEYKPVLYVSTHPFWWRNDGKAVFDAMAKAASKTTQVAYYDYIFDWR